MSGKEGLAREALLRIAELMEAGDKEATTQVLQSLTDPEVFVAVVETLRRHFDLPDYLGGPGNRPAGNDK